MPPLKTQLEKAFAMLLKHKEPEFHLLFTTRGGGAEILNDRYATEASDPSAIQIIPWEMKTQNGRD
jgi:hypothetical protein